MNNNLSEIDKEVLARKLQLDIYEVEHQLWSIVNRLRDCPELKDTSGTPVYAEMNTIYFRLAELNNILALLLEEKYKEWEDARSSQ